MEYCRYSPEDRAQLLEDLRKARKYIPPTAAAEEEVGKENGEGELSVQDPDQNGVEGNSIMNDKDGDDIPADGEEENDDGNVDMEDVVEESELVGAEEKGDEPAEGNDD